MKTTLIQRCAADAFSCANASSSSMICTNFSIGCAPFIKHPLMNNEVIPLSMFHLTASYSYFKTLDIRPFQYFASTFASASIFSVILCAPTLSEHFLSLLQWNTRDWLPTGWLHRIRINGAQLNYGSYLSTIDTLRRVNS